MPRRSSSYRTPREWIDDGAWPEGPFSQDSPTAVAYAVEIARRLEASMGERSRTAVAREANIERSTLYDLLAGRSWPDAITIAQLEQALHSRLWPEHPVPPLANVEAPSGFPRGSPSRSGAA